MRRLIVGDVHGCLAELGELMVILNPKPGERLNFDTGSADIEEGIMDVIFGKADIAAVTAIPRM